MLTDRATFSQAVRLITDFCYLKYHSKKTHPNYVMDTTCRLCGEGEESGHHIILECNRLYGLRAQCFGEITALITLDNIRQAKWSVSQLIEFIRSPLVQNLEFTTKYYTLFNKNFSQVIESEELQIEVDALQYREPTDEDAEEIARFYAEREGHQADAEREGVG